MENGKWIARRRLVTGGKVYNAGCEVPSKVLGRNARELERTGYVWHAPANQPTAGLKPIDLPPQPKAPAKKPRLNAVLVRLSDPVKSWHLTMQEARKHFPTDAAAMDFLMSHQEARDAYKLAQRVGVAEAKAKAGGKRQSISPNEIGL